MLLDYPSGKGGGFSKPSEPSPSMSASKSAMLCFFSSGAGAGLAARRVYSEEALLLVFGGPSVKLMLSFLRLIEPRPVEDYT